MVILLADGDRMWRWLVDRLPVGGRDRAQAAGWPAWRRLAGWIRGTFFIAAFHSVVIGLSLWLLGVPLVVPLAVLGFFGSFIPLFGALIFGGLAVLVTLATNGLAAGLVLLGVLLWGAAGALLAIPLTAAGYAAATHLRGTPDLSEMPEFVAEAAARSAHSPSEDSPGHSASPVVGTEAGS